MIERNSKCDDFTVIFVVDVVLEQLILLDEFGGALSCDCGCLGGGVAPEGDGRVGGAGDKGVGACWGGGGGCIRRSERPDAVSVVVKGGQEVVGIG